VLSSWYLPNTKARDDHTHPNAFFGAENTQTVHKYLSFYSKMITPVSRDERGKAVNANLISLLQGTASSDHLHSSRPQIIPPPSHVEPSLFGFAHDVFTLPLSSDRKIYIGPKMAAGRMAEQALQGANITGIVNCTPRVPNIHRPEITYCQVPVLDEEGANIAVYLDGATYFMNCILTAPATLPLHGDGGDEDGVAWKKGGSVLVHCEEGISRSATVVIAYLMRYHAMSRDEAYRVCKTRRPKVYPNHGFWKQLQEYETKLKIEQSEIPTSTGYIQIALSKDQLKDWALQSNAIFVTGRELSIVQMTKNGHFNMIISGVKTVEQMTEILNVCVDFVWSRGILTIDIDWMVFICQHALPRDLQNLPEEVIEDLITGPESDFCQAWAGEIYQKDVGRVLDGVCSASISSTLA
jgi:hypothetical protein